MGRYRDALKSIAKSIEQHHGDQYTHYCHALIHKTLRNDKMAEQSLQKTMSLITLNNEKFFLEHLVLFQYGKSSDKDFHQQFALKILRRCNNILFKNV